MDDCRHAHVSMQEHSQQGKSGPSWLWGGSQGRDVAVFLGAGRNVGHSMRVCQCLGSCRIHDARAFIVLGADLHNHCWCFLGSGQWMEPQSSPLTRTRYRNAPGAACSSISGIQCCCACSKEAMLCGSNTTSTA